MVRTTIRVRRSRRLLLPREIGQWTRNVKHGSKRWASTSTNSTTNNPPHWRPTTTANLRWSSRRSTRVTRSRNENWKRLDVATSATFVIGSLSCGTQTSTKSKPSKGCTITPSPRKCRQRTFGWKCTKHRRLVPYCPGIIEDRQPMAEFWKLPSVKLGDWKDTKRGLTTRRCRPHTTSSKVTSA